MSTRSYIGIAREINGQMEATEMVYCHFDGYPEYVGRILYHHYTDPAKIEQLIALGSLSVLGENIGVKIGFSSRLHDEYKQCLAYHRDRDDDWEHCKPIVTTEPEKEHEENFIDHMYVFRNGRWMTHLKYSIRRLDEDGYQVDEDWNDPEADAKNIVFEAGKWYDLEDILKHFGLLK